MSLVLKPLRWWHIPSLVRLDKEIFGFEAWSATMFWSELAAGHRYMIAIDDAHIDDDSGDNSSVDDTHGANNSSLDIAASHSSDSASTGKIVGYAGLAISEDEAWINNIATAPSARRRGVARCLMDDLIAHATWCGAESIFLEVAVDNLPAQILYSNYGFEGIAVRKNYYQATGTDAAVMRADIVPQSSTTGVTNQSSTTGAIKENQA